MYHQYFVNNIQYVKQTSSYPLPMSSIGPDAVTSGHLPHFDSFVTATRHNKISSGHKSNARNVVIVSQHRSDALESLLEVPKFDAHIGAAGNLYQTKTIALNRCLEIEKTIQEQSDKSAKFTSILILLYYFEILIMYVQSKTN